MKWDASKLEISGPRGRHYYVLYRNHIVGKARSKKSAESMLANLREKGPSALNLGVKMVLRQQGLLERVRRLNQQLREFSAPWSTPDIQGLLQAKQEETTTANVGVYERPFGAMLRRVPSGLPSTQELLRKLYGLDLGAVTASGRKRK
jgi:hypothetical protein